MSMMRTRNRCRCRGVDYDESGRQKNKATGPSRHEAFSVADRTATVVRAQTGVEMYRRSPTSDQRRSLRDKRGKFGDGESRLQDNYRALPEDQRRGFEEQAKETAAIAARNRMMRNNSTSSSVPQPALMLQDVQQALAIAPSDTSIVAVDALHRIG